MARSKGDVYTEEAGEIAKELTTFNGIPKNVNLNYLRNIEALIVYRVAEQIATGKESPISVEIPLIGTLEITNTVYHTHHYRTGNASNLMSFKFTPTYCFSSHLKKAFATGECNLPEIFADKFGELMAEKYKSLW